MSLREHYLTPSAAAGDLFSYEGNALGNDWRKSQGVPLVIEALKKTRFFILHTTLQPSLSEVDNRLVRRLCVVYDTTER
ncbi:uncharacterized protein PHALS_09681 [Plasmopara halstedii]|uniref:Uncharacterized protein n=1 Tax=Plasmopara halstedii TaxID=4781 RepID=A0A0P1AFD1_PLAHL|nr:uncharacterized protein PHALS_09681 [Plasmopara halstedii]CEG39434.1 hypothetical protein PHALS_09681 [Plasmopara halstedii]|eukprot:XP_024575803.1 hypothetical protein PHALS_09681 [Plasmopara halstedii]